MKMLLGLPSVLLLLASFQMPEVTASGAEASSPRPELVGESSMPTPLHTMVLEGRVLSPAKGPERGAVVVSSAGGRAVTDGEGFFNLEVELAADASSVQVTAVQSGGSSGLAASRTVPTSSRGSVVTVGTLQLEAGATCEPGWLPTFGGAAGVNDAVHAMVVHDDGSGRGPALYIGGAFSAAGGQAMNRIVRWDGASWESLGTGIDAGNVYDMVVYDDGSGGGPALYVGGSLGLAGGVAVKGVARWDGTSWSALGSGVEGDQSFVTSLAVFDDGLGGGPMLHVGGRFTLAGGQSANAVARWNGTTWRPLGAGLGANLSNTPFVLDLAVYDDGSGGGAALYVGGSFTSAGGVSANQIARWDGVSWSSLGAGLNQSAAALALHDDGSGGGAALYVGGGFTSAGGVSANRIARWDGTSWSALGAGLSGHVSSLRSHDDGSGGGPALYAGGSFSEAGGVPAAGMARWEGSSWASLDPELSGLGDIHHLEVFDEGTGAGPVLFVGSSHGNHISRWDGASWSLLGGGLDGVVHAQVVHDDGSGPALYVAGTFTSTGALSANRIARWDGASWSPLGTGMSGPVLVLGVYDDGLGGGSALYAGGTFTTAGGSDASRIARWDGASWSALGGGLNGSVRALQVFDDGSGSGPVLHVAGHFSSAGGVAANSIARWDGTSWSSMGSGLNSQVNALAVYDDGSGSGPELYAGGDFALGHFECCIARWDGGSWTAPGGGLPTSVHSLLAYDDGSGAGPSLFATSGFYGGIHRWDGTSWSSLGSGLNSQVSAIAVYDDGAGVALYVGGFFTIAGGVSANLVARWDGSAWSPLGAGLGGGFEDSVRSLGVYDDGSGPALIAGGGFTVSPAADSFLARWGGCASPGIGETFCAGDGSASPCPCGNSGGSGEGCANSTGSGAAVAGAGSASVGADDLVVSSTQLPHAKWVTLFAGDLAVNGGLGVTFGGGLRCAGGNVVRLGVEYTGTSGSAAFGPGLLGQTGYGAGQTAHFQVWYRDTEAASCGAGFNASSGLAVALEP